jgi:BlaI family penicillinase repressor
MKSTAMANNIPEPTKAELEILQVLWEFGPSTVRFVNDKLNEQREVNYTSTLKQMQIMAEKGILKRDESQMKHIYIPVEAEQKTKGQLLDRFVNTLYKGSASQLMMQLLGNEKTSKDELDEIKKCSINLLIKNKINILTGINHGNHHFQNLITFFMARRIVGCANSLNRFSYHKS